MSLAVRLTANTARDAAPSRTIVTSPDGTPVPSAAASTVAAGFVPPAISTGPVVKVHEVPPALARKLPATLSYMPGTPATTRGSRSNTAVPSAVAESLAE